jgi:hypothetical protein
VLNNADQARILLCLRQFGDEDLKKLLLRLAAKRPAIPTKSRGIALSLSVW